MDVEEVPVFEGGRREEGGGGGPEEGSWEDVPADNSDFNRLMALLTTLKSDAHNAVIAAQNAYERRDVNSANEASTDIRDKLDRLRVQIDALGLGTVSGPLKMRQVRRSQWDRARKAVAVTEAELKKLRKMWFDASKTQKKSDKAVSDVLLQDKCTVDYDDIPADPDFVFMLQDWNERVNGVNPARASRATWPNPPETSMKPNSLARINWDMWRKYLIAHCLNPQYAPCRTNCVDRAAATPFDDTRERDLPPVSMKGLQTFTELKGRVVLDLNTGALFFREMRDGAVVDKRILSDMGEKRAVFGRYWHDEKVCAHRGRDSTFERLSESFFSLSRQDVAMFIQQTETYQVSSKTHNMEKVTMPLVTSGPMEHLQMDLVDFQSFRASNGGKTFMLVVVDCFSKFLWAFPLKNKEAATIRKKLSKLFYSEGFPKVLQSDNGKEFVANESREWYKSVNIVFRTGRAYKPSTQGQVERTNRTLKQAIYHDFLASGRYSWAADLPARVFTYNYLTQTTAGRSPYEVHRGRKAEWMPGPEGFKATVDSLLTDGAKATLRAIMPAYDQMELREKVVSDERALVALERDATRTTALVVAAARDVVVTRHMEEFEAPQAIKEMLATQRTYVAPELLVYAEAPKKVPTSAGPAVEEETEETEESCKAKGLAFNRKRKRCDRASKTAASLKFPKAKKKKKKTVDA